MTDLDAIYQEAKAAKALLAELNETIAKATAQRTDLLASLSEPAKYLLNGAAKADVPAPRKRGRPPGSGRPAAKPGDGTAVGAVLARLSDSWAPYAPIARGGSKARRNEYVILSRLHSQGRIERRSTSLGFEYRLRRAP